MPKITFHSLRHSYATILLNQNVPLKVVSYLLGHARISTTADIYMKVEDKKKEEAAMLIDKVFNNNGDDDLNNRNTHLRVVKMS